MTPTDIIAIFALVVSGIAVAVAAATAGYTRVQMQTMKRQVGLEHEASFALERGRYASISGGGKPRVGGAPALVLRNRGNASGYEVEVTVSGMKIAKQTEIKPTKSVVLGVLRETPGTPVSAKLTWRTSDGQIRNQTIKLSPK